MRRSLSRHSLASLLALAFGSGATAGPFAYVANTYTPEDLTIVDLATEKVTATVRIGVECHGVAAGRARVYASSYRTGEVLVLDAASRAVVTRIPVRPRPAKLELTKDESRLYVLSLCDSTDCRINGASITVVDTATNSVPNAVALSYDAQDLVVAPDGSKLYVSDFGTSTVYVYDASNLGVLGSVYVPDGATVLAHHPDGSRIYVSPWWGDTVSVISVAQRQVLRSIRPAPGSFVRGITVHPTAPRAYLADNSGQISVIDTTNDSVLKSVGGIGFKPYAISIHPDGSRVYVVDPCGNGNQCGPGTLYVFDTASELVTNAITPVAPDPLWLGQFIGGTESPRRVGGLHCPADLCRLFPYPRLSFCEAHPHECLPPNPPPPFPPFPWCRGPTACGLFDLERFDPTRAGIFVGRIEGSRVKRAEGIKIARRRRAGFEPLKEGEVLSRGNVLWIPPKGRLEIHTDEGVVGTPEGGLPPRGEGGGWLFYVAGRPDQRPPAD